MRTTIASLLLCVCAALPALERGTPAVITLKDGKTMGQVYLLSWTFEKATFLLEQGRQARGEQKTGSIRSIELKPNDRNTPLGIHKMAAKKYADAIGNFNVAAKTAMAKPSQMLAMLNRAKCYAKLRQWDKAIKGLDEMVAKFPDWVYVVEAQFLKGAWHQAAGREDEAMKVFKALDANAPKYGPVFGQKARAKAAIGQAVILRQQKKIAEASKLTEGALKVLDPRENPDDWAKLNWQLVGDFVAANQPAKAREIYLRLRFAPVKDWYRAASFLALAKMIRAEDRIASFDHACIAAVLSGGTGEVHAEARELAKSIEKEIRADASVAKATKEEYISYIKKL